MPVIPTTFVDTPDLVSALIDSISTLSTYTPCLYLDLEGVKLSRHGSISIVTILLEVSPSSRQGFLVDVHTLGNSAFTTTGTNGETLKSIFESPSIPKVFFDVRNDSDALFSHYGIALQGIEDVQLMENASRYRSKEFLTGLAKCIEYQISGSQKVAWRFIKARGEKLFAPEKGGSYEVFNERPLTKEMADYCIGDVMHLPALRNIYWNQLTAAWKVKVGDGARNRVRESQSPDYEPHGESKRYGPWGK